MAINFIDSAMELYALHMVALTQSLVPPIHLLPSLLLMIIVQHPRTKMEMSMHAVFHRCSDKIQESFPIVRIADLRIHSVKI